MVCLFLFFYYPEICTICTICTIFFKIFDNLWLYLIKLKSESNNIDGKKMQTTFWKSRDQENFVSYWFKNQTCESRLTSDCHKWIKSSKTTFNSSYYSDVSEETLYIYIYRDILGVRLQTCFFSKVSDQYECTHIHQGSIMVLYTSQHFESLDHLIVL